MPNFGLKNSKCLKKKYYNMLNFGQQISVNVINVINIHANRHTYFQKKL